MPRYKRILVIRLSSLGDIILTTPALKVLRETFPDAQIDFLTKSEYADVIRLNPNINNLIQVANDLDFKGLRALKKELKSNTYDLVIDLHNNLRTFYLRLFFGSHFLKFKKYPVRKFLLVKFKINRMKYLPPISHRYIDTIGNIINSGIERSIKAEIFTDEDAKNKTTEILKGLGLSGKSNFICIVPSSKHFTKTYPSDYYSELINKFDSNKYSILMIGKGNDRTDIDKIKAGTGKNVYDLCDKFTVPQLAELMKKCELVICGDTGPMHIAEASGAPLVIIAGSSVREFGFYPQTDNSTIIENTGLKCRPCSHVGRDSCPKGHFKCMKEILPDAIYYKITSNK